MAVKLSLFMKIFVVYAVAYSVVAQTTNGDSLSTDSVTDPTTIYVSTPEDETSTISQQEITTNTDEMSTSNDDEQSTTSVYMTSAEMTSDMTTEIMTDESTTLKETTTKIRSTGVESTTTPKIASTTTPKIAPTTTPKMVVATTAKLTTRAMPKTTKKDCPTPEPMPPAVTPKKKPVTTVTNAKITQPVVQTTGSGETAFGRVGLPLFAITLAVLIILLTALGLMYMYQKCHSGSHVINPVNVEMGNRPTSPIVDMTAGFGNVQTIDLEEEDKIGNGKDVTMSTFANKSANNVDTLSKESNTAVETPSWLKVEPSQQNATIDSQLEDDLPKDTTTTEVEKDNEKSGENDDMRSDITGESYHGSDEEEEEEEEEEEKEEEEKKEDETVSPDTPLLPKDSNTDEMVSIDLNTKETNI